MKKSIQRDLRKYVDMKVLRELETSQYSKKADKTMQLIFASLISQLDQFEAESEEKNERIGILKESISRQQKEIIRRNEAEDRAKDDPFAEMKTLTRNEKIWAMYAAGLSQRRIAQKIGVSQQRIKEIIKLAENPLFTFNVSPENYSKFKGSVTAEERDLKICEWRDMGYTQEQIAKGVGLSRARIAQIVLEKCTQVQKTNTLSEKAKKNRVHRNTQAKIERIRKVAPWLAEKCEAREVSVASALKLIEEKLSKTDKPAKPASKKSKMQEGEAHV